MASTPQSDLQQLVYQAKFAALDRARQLNLRMMSSSPPPDSNPFSLSPTTGFPAVPAPGAAAINVLRYTVPPGQNATIWKMAIVLASGGVVDGSGNIIWRVLINDAAVEGLQQLTAQYGVFSNPNDTLIQLVENDVFRITAEVPAAQPPINGTTGALIRGWSYNINRGVIA